MIDVTRGELFHLAQTADLAERARLLDLESYTPIAPTIVNGHRVYRGKIPATPCGDLDLGKTMPTADALAAAPHAPRSDDDMPSHFRNSQARAVQWHRLVHRGLVWADCGVGKSAIAATRACDVERTLILCPKAVCGHWPGQFEQHTTAPVTVLTLTKGTCAKKAEVLAEAWHSAEPGTSVVAVLNYESAWRDALGKFIEAYPPNLLVLDEVQRAKSRGGVASQWLGKLAYQNPQMSVIGLSGTPTPQAPEDAFGVWRALDLAVFGTAWSRFVAKFFVTAPVPGHSGAQRIVQMRDERVSRFRERFDRLTFRIRAEDTLDLPEISHIRREIDLPPKVMAQYRQLRDSLVFDLDCDPPITADNALTKLLRLRQLTGGSIGNPAQRVHTAKQDSLEQLLSEVPPDEPVVVFCQFSADITAAHAAAEKAGRASCELSGQVNELETWQAATGGEVLAVQIQAGGAGVELVRARHCVYYSLGFSLGDYEQSLARVHRPGQERRVFYHHLIATGTVDELVYRALDGRRQVLDDVLEAIKEEGGSTS